MPVAKLTCPECHTILKPAKPIPAGKKVQCPKCGAQFRAAEADEAASDNPRQASPKKAATSKKPTKQPKHIPPPRKKPVDDDEDEGGSYGVVQDPSEVKAAMDDAEEEDGKQDVVQMYLDSVKSKDPRGPAQDKVMRPSNWLLICGLIGIVGWMAILIIILIPILFPLQEADLAKSVDDGKPMPGLILGPGIAAVASDPARLDLTEPPEYDPTKLPKSSQKDSYSNVLGVQLDLIGELEWYLFLLTVFPMILCMLYGGAVCYGAVCMQNLEAYRWAMASSILNIIPIHTFGLVLVSCIVLQLLLAILIDDPTTRGIYLAGLLIMECVAAAAISGWAIKTLLDPGVKAGFEYVAD